MKKIVLINEVTIRAAVMRVEGNPGRYASRDTALAKLTKTPGRAAQRRLAAGRQALAEALFEITPELGGRFQKLTAAIRAGYGRYPDFDAINELGAVALGL